MPEEIRCWTDLKAENDRLRATNEKLLDACKVALRQIGSLDDELNHPCHYVIGWHLNGQSESVTSFFDDNDFGATELLRAAIADASAGEAA